MIRRFQISESNAHEIALVVETGTKIGEVDGVRLYRMGRELQLGGQFHGAPGWYLKVKWPMRVGDVVELSESTVIEAPGVTMAVGEDAFMGVLGGLMEASGELAESVGKTDPDELCRLVEVEGATFRPEAKWHRLYDPKTQSSSKPFPHDELASWLKGRGEEVSNHLVLSFKTRNAARKGDDFLSPPDLAGAVLAFLDRQ